MFKQKEVLSVNEAARVIGVSRPTVYKLIETGELPALKLPGDKHNFYRVRRADLDALFKRQVRT